MASFVLDHLGGVALTVAVFAIDQAIQLFVTQRDKEDIAFEEKENNMMDKAVIFNKISNNKFIPLDKAADTCLKQIENLQLIFETNDFATSLDYLSDAWRALSGNNMKLFKESICESYRFARMAKSKISKNPNHLLGVYSIIIFCGFCKFSEFGQDMYLGLKHIKDTLSEMSSGSNNQSLLKSELIKTIKSSMYWKQTQKIYIKNIILFSVRMRILVENIILYSQQNDRNTTKQDTGEYKNNQTQQFGDMIVVLFPNATLNQLKDNYKSYLLNYLEWTPNIMEGKYFGGGKDKLFTKIDFWNKIYPLVFEFPETLKTINGFIYIYHKEIVEYLLCSKDVCKAMKSSMINDTVIIKSKNDMNKIKKVALWLTLQKEINKIIDDEENKYDTKDFEIPNKLVMNGYCKPFDIAFSCMYFEINVIEFDSDVISIQKFCNVLQNHRNGLFMESVKEISIKNVVLSLTLLNKLFWLLGYICTELKVLNIQSLVIKYSLYNNESYDNTLNLHFIPKSVVNFNFNNVKYMESEENNDKYDLEIINELVLEDVGSKRKIIYAMDSVEDKNDIEQIKTYLQNDLNDVEKMEDLHIFSCKCLDNNINIKNRQSNIRTMDLSGSEMTEYNFNILFNDFIGGQCYEMTKIVLCNCSITNSFLSIISEFYQTNNECKLCILELNNEKDKKGMENVITTERVTELISNELKYRNDVTISYDNQVEKVQIVANMGQIVFVPVDLNKDVTENVDSKKKKKKKGLFKKKKNVNIQNENKEMEIINVINIEKKDEIFEYILEKNGEKKGKSKWDKYKIRQFKLTNDGVFEYWDGKKLKGIIDCKNDEIISVSINENKGKMMTFGWQIATKKRTFYFAATDEDERNEWIENIEPFCDGIDDKQEEIAVLAKLNETNSAQEIPQMNLVSGNSDHERKKYNV